MRSEAVQDPSARWALVWSAVTWVAMSLYGGRVCPFVEELGFVRAAVLMAPGVLLAAALRPALIARLVAPRPVVAQGHAQIRVDLGLALLAGVVELVAARVVLDFPADSGAKIILGFLTFGLFFGVDLALRRELATIGEAPREGSVPRGGSLAQRFSVAATLMLGLSAVDALLVLGKDLAWLADLPEPQRGLAHGSVLLEIAAVFATLLALGLVVIRSWAVTLAARLAVHDAILSEVEEGRFDVRVPLSAGDELGMLAERTNRMIVGLGERERLRAVLGKVTNAPAARRLMAGAAGERLQAVILMCDVRSFTSFSEDRSPEAVVEALNRWFSVAVPIVHAHGGVVDKFIGDGMLAVFGLDEPEGAADRAVGAARALVRAAADLARDTGLPMRVGVGVHRGPVVAGTIGSSERMEFTVIGDTVNTAARLESLTKELGVDVLFSEAVHASLTSADQGITALGERVIRGRAAPIAVYAAGV